MKSPEQPGGPPEQQERKLSTPEEIAEMTRRRREAFGLGEARELSLWELEEIEGRIDDLLEELDEYNFKSCDAKTQEDWYWAEQEASAGKDRELAKAVLERFVEGLRKKKEN